MNELELSTKKSIHDPIKIKIDGKAYENNPLTRVTFAKLRELQKDAEKGDDNALYSQIKLIFPIPDDVLDKLDIRDINELLRYATQKVIGATTGTGEEKAEKNASRPAEKDSA